MDPKQPLIAAGTMTIESRMHVKLEPQNQPASEQIFEDTGTVTIAQCRAGAAPAAGSASGSAAAAAAWCPDGTVRVE